jgi:hypothetical protein
LVGSRHSIHPFIRLQYVKQYTSPKTHQEASIDVRQPGHAAQRGPGTLQLNRAFHQPTHLHSATLDAIISGLHTSLLYRPHLRSRPGKRHPSDSQTIVAYLQILYD